MRYKLDVCKVEHTVILEARRAEILLRSMARFGNWTLNKKAEELSRSPEFIKLKENNESEALKERI